ncbi:5-formyltetrahydrofolate cyclo-ligase [Reyranella sp.]|jgi:5-formyltetrahydrofolate cyclo-ligase|uniref:5-formyltetrahydrofolate cyclo-ligase n=1 Tax=Reyranella sp. TaxID=1929291 RepID=UPI002728880D|nr:5-formyltetrahydrofolate cyclo-ligase [Reyranella sp.]MDO8977471.1 5-formyltetrahydrofolate cyclo-ligase [Reyranella sp.]
MTLIERKRALRAAMQIRRQGLDERDRRSAAAGVLEIYQLEQPAELPAIVSGFWPIKDEIDIRPLMTHLNGEGCRLALPVVKGRGQRLSFRAWQPGDPLESGVFGTLQPSAGCETLEPDVLLVPLLACDAEGWRLGYGGGFYDRTLEDLRRRRKVTAIGVGFDRQLVAEVPHGADDQRLDWLLTDCRACAFV